MNLVLLFPEDFTGSVPERGVGAEAVLRDRRREHVANIHRISVGARLRVGLFGGAVGSAEVRRVDSDAVVLDVTLERDPPARLPVRLLLALPRPPTLRKVLQGIVAMGIEEIVLLQTARVEKSYWQSPTVAEAGLHEQVVLGLEQGRDTIGPRILVRKRFRPFVEDELPALVATDTALVGHPDAAEPCPRAVAGPVTLAVGPEGGFLDYEVDSLVAAGFLPVTIGERPLRVEHAVPVLIGRIA